MQISHIRYKSFAHEGYSTVKWALFMIGAKNAWKFNLLQMIKAKFVYAHVNIFYCPKEVVQRELIWITGIILAVTTVSFGVTGYSLPWDQIGYWACKIVTSVPEALDNLIPGIGKISVLTLRGGFSVNQSTLTRLYSIHTFVLPLVTLINILIHFSMLRKQGISGPL
jgi:quinol-cytochrome oxidoreductase complex cytochrome b subunit